MLGAVIDVVRMLLAAKRAFEGHELLAPDPVRQRLEAPDDCLKLRYALIVRNNNLTTYECRIAGMVCNTICDCVSPSGSCSQPLRSQEERPIVAAKRRSLDVARAVRLAAGNRNQNDGWGGVACVTQLDVRCDRHQLMIRRPEAAGREV